MESTATKAQTNICNVKFPGKVFEYGKKMHKMHYVCQRSPTSDLSGQEPLGTR
jgi:hypothetical protein